MLATQIPANTLAATRAFAVRVAHAYPIQQAILFGSRARGTAHDESDADVAVILSGLPGHFTKTKMAMNDIAYDILLDTGIRIQPLPRMDAPRALFQPPPAAKHRARRHYPVNAQDLMAKAHRALASAHKLLQDDSDGSEVNCSPLKII